MEYIYDCCDSQKEGNLLYRAAAATVRTIKRPFSKALDGLATILVGRMIIETITDFSEAYETGE